jgi:hypothetical protein
MNRKQFFTLIVLAVVIGGLGIFFYNKNKESYSSTAGAGGKKVIQDFPLNDIAHIRIKGITNEVNLGRGTNNLWTVAERWEYPANFSEISDFLTKMWELKPTQEVEVGLSQLGRVGLSDPGNGGTNAATLVEFKDGKNATLKSVLLGKKYVKESTGGPFGGGGDFPVGRYIMVPGTTPKVWLVNETFSSVETDPAHWLNKDFFKVEKPKSISVSYPGAETNSWALSRETENGEWKMADLKAGENFDASKASSLNYVLSNPSFNDVANPGASEEVTGLSKPTVIKIQTFEGFNYTIDVGAKTNEETYIKMSVAADFPKERIPGKDEKAEDKDKLDKEFKEKTEKLEQKLKNEQRFSQWTYLVSKWTLDSVLKNRKDFLSEKNEEKKENGPGTEPSTNTTSQPLPPELNNITPPPAPQNEPAKETK